jgi:hypothetical protein
MKSKIQIQKRTEFILGFLESDEIHFYSQILNGSFGYLIYYFCYELLDINFIPTNNVKEVDKPFANIKNEGSQRPQ